jgi:hypothetical protein
VTRFRFPPYAYRSTAERGERRSEAQARLCDEVVARRKRRRRRSRLWLWWRGGGREGGEHPTRDAGLFAQANARARCVARTPRTNAAKTITSSMAQAPSVTLAPWTQLAPRWRKASAQHLGAKDQAAWSTTTSSDAPSPLCVESRSWYRPSWRKAISKLTAVGFEPTQLALVELESTPLDHSGKLSLPWRRLFPRPQALTLSHRPRHALSRSLSLYAHPAWTTSRATTDAPAHDRARLFAPLLLLPRPPATTRERARGKRPPAEVISNWLSMGEPHGRPRPDARSATHVVQ